MAVTSCDSDHPAAGHLIRDSICVCGRGRYVHPLGSRGEESEPKAPRGLPGDPGDAGCRDRRCGDTASARCRARGRRAPSWQQDTAGTAGGPGPAARWWVSMRMGTRRRAGDATSSILQRTPGGAAPWGIPNAALLVAPGATRAPCPQGAPRSPLGTHEPASAPASRHPAPSRGEGRGWHACLMAFLAPGSGAAAKPSTSGASQGQRVLGAG